ncbi:MAG TPA: peptidoglycan-associated lipoprotein Pal [Nitrospirota bacterium]|nr:peptidoglycan-associated lipoprotein Pal [Nitrospirota bacterium]
MKSQRHLYLSIVLMVAIVTLWGCPKKAEVTTAPEAQTQTEKVSSLAAPAPVTETATHEAKPAATAEGPHEKSVTMAEGLKPIYFDFDKSFIRDDARVVLQANAGWLKANPGVEIRIDGNCDERGTVEYNQSLGQRRAASAKKYLTDMGISGSRISLISYGKDKPICTEHTEQCWQKNRRDDFVSLGR